MKIKVTEPDFTPITVKIVIETADELEMMESLSLIPKEVAKVLDEQRVINPKITKNFLEKLQIQLT